MWGDVCCFHPRRSQRKGAGINNSPVRWTQVPLLPLPPHAALMDSAVILLKEAIMCCVRARGGAARARSRNPEEQLCVLGEIKPSKGRRAARCWSSLLCDKMKDTNNISHTAAITGHCEVEIAGERARSKGRACVCGFLAFSLSFFSELR